MPVIKRFVCYGCDNFEDVAMSDESAALLEPTVMCGCCGAEMLFESERYALDDDDRESSSEDDIADESNAWLETDLFDDADEGPSSLADGPLGDIVGLFNQNGVRSSTSRTDLALNLLANDVVFFQEGEIAWDGESHSIVGMQFNSAVLSEYPDVEQDPTPFAQVVAEAMMAAEANLNLRAPLEDVHEALHELLQYEDMTGMTFMNLAAWHMIKVRQVAGGCAVMVDVNLIAGIPDAYSRIAELLLSLRAAESLTEPFDVLFISARNLDALEGLLIENPVRGADDIEAFKVMHVDVD